MVILKKNNNNKSSKSHLILWNDDYYTKSLREIFGDACIITSSEQLEALNFKDFDFNGAIVLAELNWNGLSIAHLFGIEIVKSVLRVQEKLQIPILFVSFFSIEQILLDEKGNKRLENQIVGGVGHDFLRLPTIPQNLTTCLEKIYPLNELQFSDVLNNLCNLKGLINGRIHERQGQFRSLENQPAKLKTAGKEIFEKSIDEMSALLNGVNEINELTGRLKYDFSRLISDDNLTYDKIQNFLKQSDNEISALIFDEQIKNEDISQKLTLQQSWKFLLLDDEPESLHILQKTLTQRGIECFLAKTVEEAEKIISDDVYNEIVVAISDYRLMEKIGRVEKQQRKQGYDFLFWLAEQERFTHLIALSGLSRKFLLESFQKYSTRVDVYSKQDLMGERAGNLFVDNLIDRGRETYEAVCSRPTVGDWKSLKPFYVAHRASTEYRLKELEINNRAIEYIKQYEELLHDGSGETRLLQPDAEILGRPTTKLNSKSPNDPASMEAFYDKLVCRRVALYLYLELKFSRDQVFAALKGHRSPAGLLLEKEKELRKDSAVYDEKLEEKLKAEVHKQYKESSKNLVTTNLALPVKVASSDLLVEEKYWLKTEIGFQDFDSEFSIARQIPYFVQIGIERLLETSLQIAERLREQNKRFFTRSGRVVIIGFNEAKDILEIIAQIINSQTEMEKFRHLILTLNKNITANVKDNSHRREILDLLQRLSESNVV